MKRLTTDTPDGNFETMLNFVYGKDGWAHIWYDGTGVDVPLTAWAAAQCLRNECGEFPERAPEEIDQELCECAMEFPECPIALAYCFATQAVHLRSRLRRHPAKVRTVCDGFACSAASVVFMAGDERVMNPASLLMIHNAWTCASGNAESLRKAAEDLETISATAANAYRERVSISGEELERLLAEESWITPAQAVEWGFATAVLEENVSQKPSQNARQLVFDRLANAPAPPPVEKTVATFLSAMSAKGE